MKLNDQLYILELPMDFGGHRSILNLSLISDPEFGLSLVDTGLPMQTGLIEEALKNEGFALDEVKQIILTHQDIDHVGSLADLKEKTGVRVVALDVEVPYIDGTLQLVKWPSPERLAQNPEFAKVLEGFKPTQVDLAVKDGEEIPGAAGAIAIATPGHTPGHMSLYFANTGSLIAGDSLTSQDGKVQYPGQAMTPDYGQALDSVKKMAKLEPDLIVCYHGGPVTENAAQQLTELAQS